ncbi:acyltransferase [Duganella callida]|uniref:Acyltransferase n=1 Tax=Duganella callida TaxID=2561932 RepID=A0A4Y9SNJ0_9BURK|nr:acyltransferase [Duganella callida]
MPGAQTTPPAQFGLINLLKAGAAQLIVLHHLAFYGPMSDQARLLLPDLIGWLGDSARIAVQVFLVIGGFLAAKSLSATGMPGHDQPLRAIWHRYAKLAPPFLAATLIAVVASLLASEWMTHDSISEPATVAQLLAHALLLHGVLGFPSVSAGAWYVAIDFQLYVMMVLMLWLGGLAVGKRVVPWLMPFVVTLGVAVSLLYFNLESDWDNWGLYFFGSYGLGIMAWWASDRRLDSGTVLWLLTMVALPALSGLLLEFRSRIALAVIVACALFLFGRIKTTSQGRGWTVVNELGRISYSVFLIHFPVCLLVNAAFTRFVPPEPELQAFGMLVAWGASLAAGVVFCNWVENPLSRVMQRLSERFAVTAPKPLPARVSAVSLR